MNECVGVCEKHPYCGEKKLYALLLHPNSLLLLSTYRYLAINDKKDNNMPSSVSGNALCADKYGEGDDYREKCIVL